MHDVAILLVHAHPPLRALHPQTWHLGHILTLAGTSGGVSHNPEDLATELTMVGRAHQELTEELRAYTVRRDRLIVQCHDAGMSLRHIATLARIHYTTVKGIIDNHHPTNPGE